MKEGLTFLQDNGLCVLGHLYHDVSWTVVEIKPLWYRQWRVSPRQTADSGLLSCLGWPVLCDCACQMEQNKPNWRASFEYLSVWILLVGHPLCPITAVLTNFRTLGPSAPGAQAFPMMGPAFNNKLKALTSRIGVSGVSSHSLCRGGAMWALSLGIPGVKAMGDWKSATLSI